MCSIFAIYSARGVNPEELWFGTHSAAHRGPDDWGFASLAAKNQTSPDYVWRFREERGDARNYQLGFGSRRLRILDTSDAGRQPMNLRNSGLWIVFNGAIYNYIELRNQLQAEHHFSTRTDTEVLVAAYQKWGANCLNHLNGMFAFAIWDTRQRKLFMARDRFGEKPLYYLHQRGRFVLASELKQFLTEGFDARIDRSALADFFLYYLQDHDDRTFFESVKQLPAAHWMEFDLATETLKGPHRYWAPEIAGDFDDSRDRQLEGELALLLADSVRLRLRSDVPVGVCLSGGLDSTSICSLAATQKNSLSFSAYTMGFPDYGDDELLAARSFAKHAGVRHREASLQPRELWEQLAEFTYFQDGPTGGPSTFASRKVFEAARADGTIVLLNGQGGDELFAGYSKFFFFWWQHLFRNGKWLRLGSSLASYSVRNGSMNWSWKNARRYAPPFLRANRCGIWNFALPEFRRNVSPHIDTGHADSLNQRLWKDLSQFSLPALLHWEDRNSMSAGTEARLPFLDYRIVEAVLATSAKTKLRSGYTKYALRKSMAQLPSGVRWQVKKRGFETPARGWFESDLARPLLELLSDPRSPLAGFFDLPKICAHLADPYRAQSSALTENDLFKLAATSVWLSHLPRASEFPRANQSTSLQTVPA